MDLLVDGIVLLVFYVLVRLAVAHGIADAANKRERLKQRTAAKRNLDDL